MKTFKVIKYLRKWGFQIQYDAEYGVDKKTGWSISVRGSFVANLNPSLLGAILEAYKRICNYIEILDKNI